MVHDHDLITPTQVLPDSGDCMIDGLVSFLKKKKSCTLGSFGKMSFITSNHYTDHLTGSCSIGHQVIGHLCEYIDITGRSQKNLGIIYRTSGPSEFVMVSIYLQPKQR